MSFGVMSSNALTAKRFERKVKEPLKAEDVLSAKGKRAQSPFDRLRINPAL